MIRARAALAFTLLFTPAFSHAAFDCPRALQKFALWRRSDVKLARAVKNGEALLLFSSLSPRQIAGLNQEIAREGKRLSSEEVNRRLPIGYAVYAYKKLIFSYSSVDGSTRRLGKRFGRYAVAKLDGDLRAVDYARVFGAGDVTSRTLFLNGPLTDWKLSFGALKGTQRVMFGTEFFDLRFEGREESTVFEMKPAPKKADARFSDKKPPRSLCETRRCSEQMELLLIPGFGRGMIRSGAETIAFLNEFRALGYTILPGRQNLGTAAR